MPVVLWTDALIYLLLSLAIGFGLYARKHEHLRAPWRQVGRSRVGMACSVVLAAYATIGLLDSMHFRPSIESPEGDHNSAYSGEILSVFDWLVTALRERQEKTYSAPFATRLYAKESLVLPDGRLIRDYPRLEHGGSHLAHPEKERSADILHTVVSATLQAAGLWLLLNTVVVFASGRRTGQGFRTSLAEVSSAPDKAPLRVVLITCGLLILLGCVAANLSLKYHILGTDKIGEDVFYQALKSVRTGLVIGTLTTLVMLPAAILLGIAAGYFRGWVDDLIQYLYTTLNSIPSVLLIAAAILMLHVYMGSHEDQFSSLAERADLRLLFLCLILGVTSWTSLCRLLRGETLKLREVDYVQAAEALGVRHARIILRHIFPNVLHIVLIAVVLDFSGLVLAEAVLSYVNIGVDPTTNSWGNMINSARLEMAREPIVWWSLAAAFGFMFTLVLAANLFSDVVRDAFDPRLRSGR